MEDLFIGDLLRCKLVTSEGKLVGHVRDIQVSEDPEHRILAFIYGRRGLFYRLHVLNPFQHPGHKEMPPDKVPWEMVARIAFPVITLKPLSEMGVHMLEKHYSLALRSERKHEKC